MCVQVTRHLLKLFDNLADLKFRDEGEEEGRVEVAVGMYSREGEYVPFYESCVCEGQVTHAHTHSLFFCVSTPRGQDLGVIQKDYP